MYTQRAATTLRSKRLLLIPALCASAVLLCAGAAMRPAVSAPPQATAPALPEQNPSTVRLFATVVDDKGNIPLELQRESFRLFEDNTEQKLTVFGRENDPVSIGIILDLSGSMEHWLDGSRAAIEQSLKAADPRDEFFLVTLKDRAQLEVPFTSNRQEIIQRMIPMTSKGPTALLDAIYLGLSEMHQARYQRKVLLLITDGGDNRSRYSDDEVGKFARESDVQVYALMPHPPGAGRATPEEAAGPDLLRKFCDVSGGHLFAVGSPQGLVENAAGLALLLRSQYVLGYEPTNRARDGKWRKIKLRLQRPKGSPYLNVYAKTGYYAPQ